MKVYNETIRTMYAISVLKAPLATSIQQLLGDKDRRIVTQKMTRLVNKGFIEKKPYGKQRVVYLLSLAGRSVLDKYLAENEKPMLCDKSETLAPVVKKVVEKPAEVLCNVAGPRNIPYPKETYNPGKDITFYRNDGLKHIASLRA